MAPSDPPRPSMRRKSSAQNLLSTFNKSTQPGAASGSTTPSVPHYPIPTAPPSSFTSAASSIITASTPTAREWDAQSLHSDGTASTAAPSAGGQPFTQASVEYLRDMVQKRIITLTYMRNVHEGHTHWFHTIAIGRADLDRAFDNYSMKKRTARFTILAMSLAALLDVTHPNDLLRGLLNTLTEWEQNKDEGDRQRLRIWKRPPKSKGGIADYSALPDTADGSYLTVTHVPFALDYTTTLLSLLDILSALYAKISKLLGPSPFPHASQHVLGLSAPHPGVSYLFSGGGQTAADGELYEVAFGGGGPVGGLSSPPPSWTPALGELVVKVDTKCKKITSQLLKELDTLARDGIRDELASLDPLLRNLPIGNEHGDND
ncbi:hypothetical protein PENSPDRAFT_685213 [Peniophora sp. CONT]|nr:hypothetical protein PENSPDRAFT_685213 [Peniophora sp. CONT]